MLTTAMAIALVAMVVVSTFTGAKAEGNQAIATQQQDEKTDTELQGTGSLGFMMEESIDIDNNEEVPEWLVNDIDKSQNDIDEELDIAKSEIVYE